MKSGVANGPEQAARSTLYPRMNSGPPPGGARMTSVKFVKDPEQETALLVETADRGTLLLVIVRSLYKIGVKIVGSQITMRNERARHWFYLAERDGSPMRLARKRQVEKTVTFAIAAMDRVEVVGSRASEHT
jgi:UTP:GlnB (protein PII) uridylyltransferase